METKFTLLEWVLISIIALATFCMMSIFSEVRENNQYTKQILVRISEYKIQMDELSEKIDHAEAKLITMEFRLKKLEEMPTKRTKK